MRELAFVEDKATLDAILAAWDAYEEARAAYNRAKCDSGAGATVFPLERAMNEAWAHFRGLMNQMSEGNRDNHPR